MIFGQWVHLHLGGKLDFRYSNTLCRGMNRPGSHVHDDLPTFSICTPNGGSRSVRAIDKQDQRRIAPLIPNQWPRHADRRCDG
jgi:hypothetical protein